MKSFFKENIVLVSGVALPLLLTIMFLGATQLGKTFIEPPRYSLVFTSGYAYNTPFKVIVQDKKAHFIYSKPDKKNTNHYQDRNKLRLYVYDPAEHVSREIELPSINSKSSDIDVVIKGLSSVSDLKESPDGYVFEYDSRGGGNLMTELFGGGYRHRSTQILRKGHNRVKVPHADSHRSSFVGWIVEDQEGDQ